MFLLARQEPLLPSLPMPSADHDAAPVRALLLDAFGRIAELVPGIVGGLDGAALVWRPAADANSIAWLVWHLTRVQDDHVADLARRDQVWDTEGWADRFGLPLPQHDTGYGHSSDDVAAVRASAEDLARYHADVHRMSEAYLHTVDTDELERVVDQRWDPPVTTGVRLVSVIGDCLEHAGQAAYVRGLHEQLG